MSALIREAAIGQIIRYVTRKKFFKYPEEEEGFVVPEVYANPDALLHPKTIQEEEESATASIAEPADPLSEVATTYTENQESDAVSSTEHNVDLEKLKTAKSSRADPSFYASITRTKTREETLPYSKERYEIDRVATLDRAATRPIVPQVTNNGDILVDWYTTDDPSNPMNWSGGKKNFATIILW